MFSNIEELIYLFYIRKAFRIDFLKQNLSVLAFLQIKVCFLLLR